MSTVVDILPTIVGTLETIVSTTVVNVLTDGGKPEHLVRVRVGGRLEDKGAPHHCDGIPLRRQSNVSATDGR